MNPRPRRKPVVYLAGPITGCNQRQLHDWREHIKDRFHHQFDFIDPTDEKLYVQDPSDGWSIVHRDATAVIKADGVLANMWKESVGTAIVIARARDRGKPVVVADPNHIRSRVLAYYVDSVEDEFMAAMRTLRTILRSHDRLRYALKANGSQQKFDRSKIVRSVRAATQDAGRDDLLVPPAVVPRVLERLTRTRAPGRGTVTTRAIRDAVWEVLRELEASPLLHKDFAGIREAWERYDADRRPSRADSVRERHEIRIHPKPLQVEVTSNRGHATIWGTTVTHLSDIPNPARSLFQQIARVEGISAIRLTKMAKGPVTKNVKAEILASRTEGLIEGKCYTNAPKGQVQAFQIRVLDPARTEDIRQTLIRHLGAQHLLRLRRTEEMGGDT